MMFSKILKAICKPKLIALYILNFKIFRLLPDDIFLKIKYRLVMGKPLELKSPKTFNEKLQWLKLYDRKPEYTKLVDKYEVRKYIAKTIGEQYLIPLLGVYDSFDDIDFDKLPNQFVLKPNHTSGDIYICKDKSTIDFNELRKKVNKWLKRKYYYIHREWPYKNVKPRIICEELLQTNDGRLPNDYKFHCFNGEPDNVMVCIERDTGNPKFYFFDKRWTLLRYNIRGVNTPRGFSLEKPKQIDKMFEIAKELSRGFPFVRIDLYNENERVYFGEFTFFPQSGFDTNLTSEADLILGNKIKLKRDYYDI